MALFHMRGLNASRLLFRGRAFQRRMMTDGARPTPKKMEGPGEDFRPPWVYVGSNLVSFAVIPGVFLYSVFFYDFGNHEHVFQPIRRWAVRRINTFFTLSPAEEKLLQLDTQQTSTPAVSEKAA